MKQTTEVFYDGACGLCTASRDWAKRRDVQGLLVFRDAGGPGATDGLPVDLQRRRREMLVRLPDGQLVGGFAGWLAVLRVLPRWHAIAGVLALPPLRWLGPPLYRLVARHRHRFRSTGRPPAC